MTSYLSKTFFAANRARVASALAPGLIYLVGNVQTARDDTDTDNLFRQEANFFYMTGVHDANCAALISAPSGDLTLLIPRHGADDAIWHGVLPSEAALAEKYGAVTVAHTEDAAALIKNMNPDTLYVLNPNVVLPVSNIANVKRDGELLQSLIQSRIYKSAEEIEVMRRITHISGDAHVQLMKQVKHAKNEMELEALFMYETRRKGAKHLAYNSIVGSGKNGAILHYTNNDAPIHSDDLLLVDAGAELDLYASDITRCFPASGRFSTAQREVYTIVLNAQKAVLAAMKPGVDWTDMHRLAERTISQGLIDYGFVRGTVDEIMGSRTVSVFFPHGLGHMIGLAVHDVGGYAKGVERIQEAGIRYLRARVILQEGMCLTVEPGVYFNDELLSRAKKDDKVNRFIVWEKVDQFRNFGGVRIEDDVAVTATGIDNLTACPKEIDEIEKLMNE